MLKNKIILSALFALALGCPHSLASAAPLSSVKSSASVKPSDDIKTSALSAYKPRTHTLSWNEKIGAYSRRKHDYKPAPQVAAIWEGVLPKLHRLKVSSGRNSDTVDYPMPHKSKTLFSRQARLPYIDKDSGTLILEYVLPPLCDDGVSTFCLEQIILSEDGLVMTFKRHRIYAPAPKQSISCIQGRHTTLRPFVFNTGERVFVFKKSGSKIISCNLFLIKDDAIIPVFKKNIFPSPKISAGFYERIL